MHDTEKEYGLMVPVNLMTIEEVEISGTNSTAIRENKTIEMLCAISDKIR